MIKTNKFYSLGKVMDWQRSWFCMCITKNRKKCTYREYSAMERCTLFLVIKCICFFTCFYYVECRTSEPPPVVNSVTVLRKTVQNLSFDTGVNYLVKVEGENLNPRILIRVTAATGAWGSQCVFQSDNINDDLGVFLYPRFINETLAFFTVIVVNSNLDEPLYLCVGLANAALNLSISEYRGELIKWIHQGQNVFLVNDNRQNRSSDRTFSYISSNISSNQIRTRRETFLSENENEPSSNSDVQMDTTMQSLDKRKRAVEDVPVVIHGLRVETAENSASFGEDGVIELLAHTTCKFRLFGQGLSSNLQLAFTTTESDDGFCEFPSSEIFKVLEGSVTNHSAVVEIHVPPRPSNNAAYFLCVKDGSVSNSTKDALQKKLWFHQGSEKWLQFRVYEKLLPVWITIIIIISLLFFSALFSGLTLGLMSMDKTDLKILCTTGTELERQYASAILPVRSHGSLLLCSLLLGNVLVNSVLTILMDDLTSGLIAVVFSTLAIVIFGEIMPQAICSRHGLAVGAKTIYITKFVILVTCVVAFPISKILDCMLGEEIGNVYNRERLKELVKTGTDIEKDEVNIISGALELRKKTVADVMTKLEDVYMLDYHAILDFETVSEIMKSGFSRIPVYEGRRSNIVAMLFIKDLAFIDPDDNTPLKQVCDFYQNQCYFVFEDQTLDVLFKHFKDGNKGHMAFVTRVNSEGEGDPFYEAIGLVTLEDVIEELIQAEIVDETDVFTDNRSKRKRERKHMKQDFTTFCERRENQRIHISPQLTLATFQYLSTTVDAFKPDVISETILRRLIKQDVIYQIKVKNKEKGKADPSTIIYKQGKPVDYFVLILEGRVEVIVGKEELKFESGPFTYFGTQALRQNISVGGDSPTTAVPTSNAGSLQSVSLENNSRLTFVPDYTVRAITEVFYIKIKRSLYMAAKKATLMGNSQKTDDHFDDEVDKLLHSLDEDDKSQDQSQESPLLSRNPNQGEKESQQRSDTTAVESPGSQHAPVNPSNPSSPLEPNGRLRSPLSPVKSRLEDNSILKIFSDKLNEGNEKFISAENLSGEERTNLLCQAGEIS